MARRDCAACGRDLTMAGEYLIERGPKPRKWCDDVCRGISLAEDKRKAALAGAVADG